MSLGVNPREDRVIFNRSIALQITVNTPLPPSSVPPLLQRLSAQQFPAPSRSSVSDSLQHTRAAQPSHHRPPLSVSKLVVSQFEAAANKRNRDDSITRLNPPPSPLFPIPSLSNRHQMERLSRRSLSIRDDSLKVDRVFFVFLRLMREWLSGIREMLALR